MLMICYDLRGAGCSGKHIHTGGYCNQSALLLAMDTLTLAGSPCHTGSGSTISWSEKTSVLESQTNLPTAGKTPVGQVHRLWGFIFVQSCAYAKPQAGAVGDAGAELALSLKPHGTDPATTS